MDFSFVIKCCFVLLVSILILLVCLWQFYHWKHKRLLAFANSLPVLYPKKFILGNLGVFLLRRKPGRTKLIFDELKKAAEKRLEIFCIWTGPKPLVYVQNPSDIQAILNNSKAMDKGFHVSKVLFGEGLIVATGSKWKKSRKIIGPIFHPLNLRKLVPILNKSSSYLVDNLVKLSTSGPVDIFPEAMAASVRSVCAIIFGCEVVSELDRKTIDTGIECMNKGFDLVSTRCLFPPLWSSFLFDFIYRKEMIKCEDLWNKFFSASIKIIKRKQEENDRVGLKEADLSLPINLLGVLPEVTEKELRDECVTLIGTGTETVAVALSSCLLILAMHQDIQETLYKEIESVMGKQPRDITLEDLSNLPYLHRVIQETLRISIVVPLMTRKLEADIRLRNYTLPKGETIILSIVGVHFDPKVYPNPRVFDPDHHTPENTAKRHPYSFLPFAGGPRNCIGKTYAYMSLKINLINLLKAFKITSQVNIEDLRYEHQGLLKSIDGYVVQLHKRN